MSNLVVQQNFTEEFNVSSSVFTSTAVYLGGAKTWSAEVTTSGAANYSYILQKSNAPQGPIWMTTGQSWVTIDSTPVSQVSGTSMHADITDPAYLFGRVLVSGTGVGALIQVVKGAPGY